MNDELRNELDEGTFGAPEIIGDEDDGELTEELATTATIEGLLDGFIADLVELSDLTLDVSLDGNPVKTHVALGVFSEEILEMAHKLRSDLIAKLAERGDTFDEQGNLLRKQVIPEEN